MVKLNKIYTRTGDDGTTGLVDGSRLEKHAPRLEAIGAVDEANCALGVAVCAMAESDYRAMLAHIQNDLFDLGADITRPGSDHTDGSLRIQPGQVERLEAEIDEANENLEPLRSFVLRGGTDFAAALHLACTVCRRAERMLSALASEEPINPHGLKYINRLSDLLFVLARAANDSENADVLWQPGQNI